MLAISAYTVYFVGVLLKLWPALDAVDSFVGVRNPAQADAEFISAALAALLVVTVALIVFIYLVYLGYRYLRQTNRTVALGSKNGS